MRGGGVVHSHWGQLSWQFVRYLHVSVYVYVCTYISTCIFVCEFESLYLCLLTSVCVPQKLKNKTQSFLGDFQINVCFKQDRISILVWFELRGGGKINRPLVNTHLLAVKIVSGKFIHTLLINWLIYVACIANNNDTLRGECSGPSKIEKNL